MAVEISHLEVFNNIVRFKNILEEPHRKISLSDEDRSYPILLNRKTGDLRFLEAAEMQQAPPSGWKRGEIHVREKGKRIYLEFLDEKSSHLKAEELAPFAWRILQETSEALNQMLAAHGASHQTSQGALWEKTALKDLSQIHLSNPHHGLIEMLPGWRGRLGRVEAELILEGMPVGSYLLREGDTGTRGLVLHLSEANKVSLRAYLCTVVEARGKVSDLLLLQSGTRWTWYRDNPDLHDSEYEFFPSPGSALHKIHHRARHPMKGN